MEGTAEQNVDLQLCGAVGADQIVQVEGESGSLDDSLVHRQYRIDAILRNATSGAITRLPVAVGGASLNFVRSASAPTKWVIATWSDFRIPGPDSITFGKRRLDNK